MITFDKVTFSYKKKRVLNGFSLSIAKGSVCGLLGKNGAGKSTLLYLMTGLLKPQKGGISIDGGDITKRKAEALQQLFIVPEEFDLPNVSLKRYVDLYMPFYPDFSHEQLKNNLKCFEMDADIHLGQLSMGQKKKAFMSFALAANTPLLVMDEPTNGLDIPSKSQFRKFIAGGMTDEKTILISSHQVRDMDNLLDRIIIIDNNEVLLNQPVADICRKLYFAESSKEIEDALYVQPSVQGNKAILKNTGGEESQLDIEILFNAALSRRDSITKLFI